MTCRTRSARMFRVIEYDVEAPERRKRFHLSTLRVCMADRTHLTRLICELLLVTTRARRMRSFARQRWLRRVVFTAMAKQTRQARVILVVMLELRVISLGRKKAQKAQKSSENYFVLSCGLHSHFAGL